MELIQPRIPFPWDLPTAESRRRRRWTIVFIVGVHLLLVRSQDWLSDALFLVASSPEGLDILSYPGDDGLGLAYSIQNFGYSSDIDRLSRDVRWS